MSENIGEGVWTGSGEGIFSVGAEWVEAAMARDLCLRDKCQSRNGEQATEVRVGCWIDLTPRLTSSGPPRLLLQQSTRVRFS